MRYLVNRPDRVLQLLLDHIQIAGTAVLIAVLIGVPLGILATRVRWLEGFAVGTAGLLYTIPSLALLALLIPLTGLGQRPAIVAVVLYSLLVIIRNTIAGIGSVDPATLDAARGMGMTKLQQLFLVQLPLGLPVIVAGIRTATVAGIGIATIGAAIGAQNLGLLIFEGISRGDFDRLIGGVIVVSALALLADWALTRVSRALRRDAAAT
jgi:osmoprotectant transport system permease protein